MSAFVHHVLCYVAAVCVGRYWGSWAAKQPGWRAYAALALGSVLVAAWWWTGRKL